MTPAQAGHRLDHILQTAFPAISRTRLQSWIKDGHVRVNGRESRPSAPLRAGDRIEAGPAPLKPLRAEPEEIPLTVLYEDTDLAAIDKPAGMVVHAGAGVHEGTLVNALLHRFGALSTSGDDVRPGIVHRLDRLTSGVILVAKTDAAHQHLAAQFAARTVRKIYLALVHGRLKDDQGVIDRPIARDPSRRVRMTSRLNEGRHALSEYTVLRRWPDYTLAQVRIGTGRTHQIRVHLSSLGHPVVGDTLYGAPGGSGLDRFFLHAHRIGFALPSSGETIEVVSPLPEELVRYMDSI